MAEIKSKWKAFAIGEVLCNIEQSDWAALFDRVVAVNSEDELQAVLEETGTCVWEPFEDWSRDRLTYYIEDLATRLNATDLSD